MSATSNLPRCAFGRYEFPYKRIAIKGGLRDHVHEFPHADGGKPEKLGRKLYTISITSIFVDQAVGYATPLWPGTLADLRAKFEAQTTDDLRLPNVGTIKAYAVTWNSTLDAKMTSGEEVEIEFREDDDFPPTSIVEVGATDLATAMATVTFLARKLPSTPDLFDSLAEAVNSVTAVADQVELVGNQIEARVRKVSQLCAQIDRAVSILNKPVNHRLLDAVHELWQTSNRMHANILQTATPPVLWTVPRTMTIGQIAQARFGATSRAVDILKMNPIEDAFRVLPGTQLLLPAA